MKAVEQINKWHDTKLGLLTFFIVELILFYAFVSWAINNGSIIFYLVAIYFMAGTVKNLFKLLGRLVHDVRKH